jgi:thymidylate kinase
MKSMEPWRIDLSALRNKRTTQLISFSGIDGAGKSTQIEGLCDRLRAEGLQVRVIRFWDDIAKLTHLRESASHRIFKGDKGIGTPTAPINRRDKNVRSWPMSAVRLFIYFLDAISVRHAVKNAIRSEADVVIFDRYIYDELANLSLWNPFTRVYIRLIMAIVPRLHLSYVLDAAPANAFARKPEYPLEFLKTNRQSYLALSILIGGLTIVPAMPIDEVKRAVIAHAFEKLSFKREVQQNQVVTSANESGIGSAKLSGA